MTLYGSTQSHEDKLDTILLLLQRQDRTRRIRMTLRMLFFLCIVFGYYCLVTGAFGSEWIAKARTVVQQRVVSMIVPLVQDMVKDMTKNIQSGSGSVPIMIPVDKESGSAIDTSMSDIVQAVQRDPKLAKKILDLVHESQGN